MDDLYNTVLTTYMGNFSALTPRTQFHFASRLHLWHDLPETANWLAALRPQFTVHDHPLLSARQAMAEPAPKLSHTAQTRAPYFTKYPSLQKTLAGMFRLLFVDTVYDLPGQAAVPQLFELDQLQNLYEQLLNDDQALQQLSSFAVNYLYLYARFVQRSDDLLPLDRILDMGSSMPTTDALEASLNCYYYTHCIIAESLFYARPLPDALSPVYETMLERIERLIDHYFDELRLDNCLEFLVCCRMVGGHSDLEAKIMERCRASLGPDNYLIDDTTQREQNLTRAEHRNVLFLMSQTEPHFSRG